MKLLGDVYEARATEHLMRQGCEVLARNYRCKLGEIDIIVRERGVLVFVEVRARKHSRYGSPADSVTWRKQQKIRRCAQHFLLSNVQHTNMPCRFALVTFEPPQSGAPATPTWIRAAFD